MAMKDPQERTKRIIKEDIETIRAYADCFGVEMPDLDENGEVVGLPAPYPREVAGVVRSGYRIYELGQKAVVHMPKGSTKPRFDNIAAEGATVTIEEVNYDPFIYFIGSTDGWSSSDQKLALVDDAKGVYTGYVYIADPNGAGLQFKFQRVAGSWDNEINAGAFVNFGGAATNEGGNFGVNAGEGVYYFDVNLSEGTITATKVETMGIIGGFNSWGGDAVMTWNAKEYCFEATNVGVTADGWKFRINGGWDINLGGSLDNLTAGGANLSVAGNTVKLYPTRKTKDNIFCTVK